MLPVLVFLVNALKRRCRPLDLVNVPMPEGGAHWFCREPGVLPLSDREPSIPVLYILVVKWLIVWLTWLPQSLLWAWVVQKKMEARPTWSISVRADPGHTPPISIVSTDHGRAVSGYPEHKETGLFVQMWPASKKRS